MMEGFRGSLDLSEAAVGAALDRAAISDLVRVERRWRDTGDWDSLAAAYTDDSRVHTSWFHGGTGREFAQAARTMASKRRTYHVVTPIAIRLRGNRALAESSGEIRGRTMLEGVEVHMIMYCRFVSRVRKEEDGWRLASFDGIYEYDTLAPVNPNEEVKLDMEEFSALRPACRVWAYVLARHGYTIDQDAVIGDDRPADVERFYAEAERWLETGDASA